MHKVYVTPFCTCRLYCYYCFKLSHRTMRIMMMSFNVDHSSMFPATLLFRTRYSYVCKGKNFEVLTMYSSDIINNKRWAELFAA